jgi:LuxR family transcriptional regulator, maltose regulon positive regulatory protein
VSTPVLATKLFPPSRRETLVARPRLAEQLDASLADDHHLTLVSAPAGFGKTTLLTAWLESLDQERREVVTAWVSLDSGDNDFSRLLSHHAAALNGPGLDVDATWAQQPTGDGTAAMTASRTVPAPSSQPVVRRPRPRPGGRKCAISAHDLYPWLLIR